MTPELTAKIGKAVTELLQGSIRIGAVKLGFQFPLKLQVEQMANGFRITTDPTAYADRPGIDAWIEYVDVMNDGRVFARGRRGVFEVTVPVQ